ncbi:parasitic phase-specific protein PSP-1 [Histoplasma ohiense]|nr:parasitic phase-specific protein PSP-1 [Histoplasma ohiense (nom. inval.)]
MSATARAICKEISPQCPVEFTPLGYFPNLGANIFFCCCFGIFFFVAFVVGVWKKTWTFTFAVTGACVLECVGYAGRILIYKNPWGMGFTLQIVTIILGPTFLCAAVYLTLKHAALAVGPGMSRIKPYLYTWIFIPCDISCLVLQGIGGGVAASGDQKKDKSLLDNGNRIIMAGIGLQVGVLSLFGIVALDYYWRVSCYHRTSVSTDGEREAWRDGKFRNFAGAVSIAYLTIYARCVYRIAEMAGGWGNPIMRHEPSFIVMESVMILIAAAFLSCFPAGILFPRMGKQSCTPKT